MREQKKRHGIRTAMVMICGVIVVTCTYVFVCDLLERHQDDLVVENARGLYLSNIHGAGEAAYALNPSAYAAEMSETAPTASSAPEEAEPTAADTQTADDIAPVFQEDFRGLYEENKHIVGWLSLGERIDYPVVHSDNDFYLHHNFYGKKDSNGTLFLNMDNRLWPRDDVLLIHGHNMKSRAMFGKLLRYEQYDYLRQYPVVTFRTIYDAADVYYVPIAAFNASMISGNKDYFDIARFNFEDDPIAEGAEHETSGRQSAEYRKYLDTLLKWSLWESPFEVDVEDDLLMLVTCSYRNEDGRFMLVCRKLRDGETPDAVVEAFMNR